MAGARHKQHVQLSGNAKQKKKKRGDKAADLQTADDYQTAADFEESAGGKHRAGDPVKSGRAFVRALDFYDRGLQQHPNSFDLAYNKARLQLEISQQPALVGHVGLSSIDWLRLTLQSHRYALNLDPDDKDILFNTAQVLTSLAEQLSEQDQSTEASALLREALELLSHCLSRQEQLFEQFHLDFPDAEDGGVQLEENEPPASATGDVDMLSEQSAVIEIPVTASDLLDTAHASLSALTTLVPLSDPQSLESIGEMAKSLTTSKAPDYIRMLPVEDQNASRLALARDTAIFTAALSNVQFEAELIDFQAYLSRLDVFNIPGKAEDADTLISEAEARAESVLSALDRFDEGALLATLCWKQASLAQDLYTSAVQLGDGASRARAVLYKSKGDVELLRHRIATLSQTDLPDSVRRSGQRLIQNAQTYYKGSASLAKVSKDESLAVEAHARMEVAQLVGALLYNDQATAPNRPETMERLAGEGYLAQNLAFDIAAAAARAGASSSIHG